ncbi:hypothetical protein MPSEU_001015900 [Mayamaea pseudoterrestris]|nr:hypothetical protein MPSEU_001015900 [Mayamaea pseudoterrestris]
MTTTAFPNVDEASFKENVVVQMSPAKTCSFIRPNLQSEITKQVIRKKLFKQRHLIIEKAIDPAYLDSLFPQIIRLFTPQTVYYNGGVAKVPEWKISCYVEVMPGGIPTTEPNLLLFELLTPLLEQCNQMFLHWYRQQHACNSSRRSLLNLKRCNDKNDAAAENVNGETPNNTTSTQLSCHRLMTFITRYTPAPGEQALLKHVDGAGKVDGSIVVALPMEAGKKFTGGGLTVWDGKDASTKRTLETHYETRNGDVAFIDR